MIKEADSGESDVDHFYNNMLPDYFPKSMMYGIEQESRPLQKMGMKVKTDFTIRYIRNGQPKKVIVIECKRKEKESSNTEWRGALNQAIEYVQLIRVEAHQNSELPIYIVIGIGTYLRVYIHRKGEKDAEDFPMSGAQLLELAKDEEKVHNILMEIQRLTAH
jgi:hypothetical protein